MSDWHVAMTRPNMEMRVVSELRERDFRAVCPAYRKEITVGGTRRDWRGRKRIEVVTIPAFTNYVIFSGPHWQRASKVKELTTIIRCTGEPDKPASLPQAAVAWLLGPAGDGIMPDLCEAVQGMHDYLTDQHVTITSGLYADKTGIVQSSTYARVRILVGSAEMNLPKEMVQPALASSEAV